MAKNKFKLFSFLICFLILLGACAFLINYFIQEKALVGNLGKINSFVNQEEKNITKQLDLESKKEKSINFGPESFIGSIVAQVYNAGELVIINEKGEKTGILDHEVIEEIDYSMYLNYTREEGEQKDFFRLFLKDGYDYGSLIFQVTGILDIYAMAEDRESIYDLKIALKTEHEDQKQINLMAVPIDYNVVHQYRIDWKNLNIKHGITMKIDKDGDGEFEESKEFGSELIRK